MPTSNSPVADQLRIGNSNDAREILKTWRPEILISDVVLGAGETGPRLAEEAIDIDDSIKVLLMSGYPEFALEGDGQLDTSWRLLKKTFGRQALRESLQKLYA
jgi:two-component SAPR family response regulator